MSTLEEGPNQRWLTRAKLDLPVQHVRQVERARLLDHFLGKRLGLIVAPPGFGKSILVSQWCQQQMAKGTHVAWLSLDEADAEPMQFFSYLIIALAESGLELDWLVPLAERGLMESDIRSATSGLLELIAKPGREVVLVLDDYHLVAGPPVDQLMSSILAIAPGNLTVVLTSRIQPDLDLARLMAAGLAAEIPAEALRISRDEVEAVLGRKLDPAALDLLHQLTEGWPVAIQLARYLLESDGDTTALLEGFKGDTGHIASYLTDQVLRSITTEQRQFLLQTSILERFDASLADGVMERNDSSAVLHSLGYLNALLVPLGEPKGWFRYHHLFAEYLQGQLLRDADADVARLHANASRWFEASGDLTSAVHHARKAADFARCAQLIEQAGGWELILYGGIGYLRNLLRNIPAAAMREFPRIQIAQAYLHAKDGRLFEARTDYELAREGGRDAAPDTPLARDLLNVGALIDGYEDRRSQAALDRLGVTIASQRQSDPLTIGVLQCDQSLAAIALGKIAEAETRAHEAMRAMRRARSVLGLTYGMLHAGLAAFYQGHFHVAEAHLGAACRMAAENFAFDPGPKAQSNLLMTALNHWRGFLTDDQKAAFLADMEHMEAYDGWFELYANAIEVECASAGDPAVAIARAHRIASDRGLRRLELLADAHSLRCGPGREGQAIAHKLRKAMPDEVWRHDPFLWRPFVESRLAIAGYFGDRDRAAAIRLLEDAQECSRSFGAAIYLIDALVMTALARDRSGDRAGAMSDLIEALSMAAPEQIARPFLRFRQLNPLLRVIVQASSDQYLDMMTIGFARDILSKNAPSNSMEGDFEGKQLLSAREQEVLEELAGGRSNKEIARSLGMTENTVKFHLKHIFAKLSVQTRTQAIARMVAKDAYPNG